MGESRAPKPASPARRVAWRALVDLDRGSSTRLHLDRRRLSAVDRDLALELARGVERRRLWLDFVLGGCVERGLPADPMLLAALRLGAYQLLELERVPDYAAVSECVALVRRGRAFVNAVLRRLQRQIEPRAPDPARPRREVALAGDRTLVLDSRELPDPRRQPAEWIAVRHALPPFAVERWVRAHGVEEAERIARASSRVPPVLLRAAPRAGAVAELAAALAAEGVRTEPHEHPRLLHWTGGASPFAGRAFAEGAFAVQDGTALRAAEAVGALPGETVVDLCAGPGTKATALAEAVAPSGHVHAYDISERRRAPIREAARRLGLADLLVVHDDPATLPLADRVLVDVPCSNTGVLARRVEARRRLEPAALAELAALQRSLLAGAVARVRPGGLVVYSTCSLEPEENDAVVETALGAGLGVVERRLTLPDTGHDGGFFAVLRREGAPPAL